MTHSAISRLESLFATETALMREFIAILQKEAEVLATPAVGDALNATTASKNTLAQQLSASAASRHAIYEELGYKDKDASNARLRQDHPALNPAIDALAQAAQQAHEINEDNGIVIDAYLKYNQQAMNELRILAGQDLPLYDASGRARQSSASKTSIKAG
ncbi:flagella synthesis protein FlgN [Paracandidimonas soli]|uniref:flagella synthesis protein FlgN n=1 Tax=Paracandidimonas soli TaxID=1917182 RepID=UPI003341EA5A